MEHVRALRIGKRGQCDVLVHRRLSTASGRAHFVPRASVPVAAARTQGTLVDLIAHDSRESSRVLPHHCLIRIDSWLGLTGFHEFLCFRLDRSDFRGAAIQHAFTWCLVYSMKTVQGKQPLSTALALGLSKLSHCRLLEETGARDPRLREKFATLMLVAGRRCGRSLAVRNPSWDMSAP